LNRPVDFATSSPFSTRTSASQNTIERPARRNTALGQEGTPPGRQEACLHVERHHRAAQRAAGDRPHGDVEQSADKPAMHDAEIVAVLGARDEAQMRAAVHEVERLDAAMVGKGDVGPKNLHQPDRPKIARACAGVAGVWSRWARRLTAFSTSAALLGPRRPGPT
jgi:hypothetical protein